jgi:glucokinase
MLVLAGDIGGTKVHLALYDAIGGSLVMRREASFAVKNHRTLEDIALQFLGTEKADVACFGASGPKTGSKLRMANLSWVLDTDELASALGIRRVYLLNDIEANGYGIAKCRSDEIRTINGGNANPTANRALLAAGTGLGQGFLLWDGGRHIPYASEGGHVDFAPRNDDEFGLLRYLMRKYGGRVSVERVVSGMGISSIYAFLRDVRGMDEPKWLRQELAAADDLNSVIVSAALAAKSGLCEKTWTCFYPLTELQREISLLPFLHSAGSILAAASHRASWTKWWTAFMQAFRDKGRLTWAVETIPVHVIQGSTTALKGAAAYAEARIAEDNDYGSRHSERRGLH